MQPKLLKVREIEDNFNVYAEKVELVKVCQPASLFSYNIIKGAFWHNGEGTQKLTEIGFTYTDSLEVPA